MRGVTVKTPERVAEAQRLRADGWKLREIAIRMGVAPKTVHNWISDLDGSRGAERKRSYRGVCDRCGGPTDGSNGRRRAATTCRECLRWSDEQIIDAICAWADSHGGIPPRVDDWRTASLTHPCHTSVVRRLGWNEALLRAGFELNCDRRPETQAWIEQSIAAGRPIREIADELGVTPAAIYQRLRVRRVTVTELRAATA